MVVWWGTECRGQVEAITADDDYRCPRCTYFGHLLLRRIRQRTRFFFVIPLWWRDRGGMMVCPVCGNTAKWLGPRKFKEIPSIDGGPEFVAAMRAIDRAVKEQFPE